MVLPGVQQGSLCCAASQLFMARRPRGYCPDAVTSQRLPFAGRCTVDAALGGAYVPDAATASAAAYQLCVLEGCVEAMAAVSSREPLLGAVPRCEHIRRAADGGSDWMVRVGVAAATMFVTLLCLVALHAVVTPLWLKAAALSSSGREIRSAGRGAISTSLGHGDVVFGLEVTMQASPPPSPSRVAMTPLSRPWALGTLFGAGASGVGGEGVRDAGVAGGVAAGALSAGSNLVGILPPGLCVEAEALRHLEERRERCRAHISLLCAAAITATLARVFLAAVRLPAVNHLTLESVQAVLLIAVCVWQLGVLARAAGTASATAANGPEPQEGRCVSAFLGDLRAFAVTTAACELLVLVVAVGAPGTRRNVDAGVEGALASEGAGSATMWHFLLEQVALSLALIRLYTAWLALSLHRIRRELAFAVLPGSPEAARHAVKGLYGDFSHMLAWVPDVAFEDADPAVLCLRLDRRRRARRRACALASLALLAVATAAATVIWRGEADARVAAADAAASSCRTAAHGVSFCVAVEYLGLFEETSSHHECCAMCDATEGCDAWSYAEAGGRSRNVSGGRCWRISFVEAPCRDRPSHFSCRCSTDHSRMGGYRTFPGDMVWRGPEGG